MTGRSSDAVTVLESRIIIQIEYYFGDFNLLYDKFLQEKIQEDDGWVSIDTMLNVKRLKEITDDAHTICEALKKSPSDLMEVVEQGDKIRRSPSKFLPGVTKKTRKEIIARTVCAKPFPLNVKLDDLLEFFEDYGHVVKIWVMKRRFLKKTMGCVYVTFANKEEAAKFVNEEETQFKKQDLKVKRFKTKCRKHTAAQKKSKGKKNRKRKPHKKAKKSKGKKDRKLRKHKKGEDETKEKETDADLEKRVSQRMIKNAVLHLKGLNSETSRHQVRAFFSKYAEVVWVYIIKDAAECCCYIRLLKPDSAGSTLEKAKTANDGKIVINDSEIEVRVVVGDEELQYWKKAIKNCEDRNKRGAWGWGWSRRQGGRNQGGRQNLIDGQINRVGPQGKRKLNRKDASSDGEEHETEEPPAKVNKSEIIIKFNEVLKFYNASSDGEEQDTKEPAPKVTKSEMAITRPQGKRKLNRKEASSDGEEQETVEPPAKVNKSELIFKFDEDMTF
ncbi:hypothetical protein BsWGS_00885 [Bradybaena similaris]